MTAPPTPPRPSLSTPVRIGTRGSRLATTQTGHVADALVGAGLLEEHELELVRIRTEGDRLTGSLASLGGAGVFVAALREAVLDGRCDLAVHSFKDLPTAPAPGLVVAAVPERADPRDALCARDGLTLADLPQGARVGTGSPRRAAQLRALRPDLEVVDIRGNVGTRLGRVAGTGSEPSGPDGTHDLDAVVLAAAGLERIGRTDAVTEFLDRLSPAPGQGALAIECRVRDDERQGGAYSGEQGGGHSDEQGGVLDDARIVAMLAELDHLPTRLAVTAERSLLGTLEAGCAAPVGALGRIVGEHLSLEAVVSRVDGSAQVRCAASVRLPDGRAEQIAAAVELGEQVAHNLLADGAAELAPVGPGAGGGSTSPTSSQGSASGETPLSGPR